MSNHVGKGTLEKFVWLLSILMLLSLITLSCKPNGFRINPGIQGKKLTEIELPSTTPQARGVQVDKQNKIAYVVDEHNGELVKVNVDSTDENFKDAKMIASDLLTPTTLVIDWVKNRAYVTREGNDYIVGQPPPKKWNVLTSVSLTNSNQDRRNYVLADNTGQNLVPWQPVGIARGKSGRLYVADLKGMQLIGIDLSKKVWWEIQTQVPRIRAVAVDAAEKYIYYTTSEFAKTVKPTGTLYRVEIGKKGGKVAGPVLIAGRLKSPAGITLSADGKVVYIAEFGRESSNTECKEGQISQVPLEGEFSAPAKVVGECKEMKTPHGIWVDEKTGVMYVVEVESGKLFIFD